MADIGTFSATQAHKSAARRRGTALFALLLVVASGLFVALGIWQVQRRAWKLDLIARVEARIHAAPVTPPAADDPRLRDPKALEYLAVSTTGRFLPVPDTLVQAVSELGAGYWVMAPFETDTGLRILVNRGFVPHDARGREARQAGEIVGPTRITGLLRVSEPGGGFLRANDPAADRWYSRDVEAIATARQLGPVAPYFIDADGSPNTGGWPVGGLTIIRFANNHLVYALTWFGLAGMSLAGAVLVWRRRV